MKLSDLKCKKAEIRDKQYRLADGHGLSLLVRPNGSKLWQYRYEIGGKYKTASYGEYPYTTLAQARELHLVDRSLWQQGIDPMEAKKQRKEAEQYTFYRAAELWRARWRQDKTEKHDSEVWRRLELDIFPVIGHIPANALTAAQVRDCILAIEARGALDIAKRQLQKCAQIMRYAVAHDMAERNPVADLKPSDILPTRKKRNYSRIEAKDLPELLRNMDAYVGNQHTRLALQLMALTFVRTSELIGAKWEEIDFDAARWEIPAERMKMKTPHIVPLSKQALSVLRELESLSYGRDFVFPADTCVFR